MKHQTSRSECFFVFWHRCPYCRATWEGARWQGPEGGKEHSCPLLLPFSLHQEWGWSEPHLCCCCLPGVESFIYSPLVRLQKASDKGADKTSPCQALQLRPAEQDSCSSYSLFSYTYKWTQKTCCCRDMCSSCIFFTWTVSRLISAFYLWSHLCPVVDVFHAHFHSQVKGLSTTLKSIYQSEPEKWPFSCKYLTPSPQSWEKKKSISKHSSLKLKFISVLERNRKIRTWVS